MKLWEARIKEVSIQTLHDVKNLYNSADIIGNNRVIFDIKGNHYRIITVVVIRTQTVYIRWVGPHSEYDKINAHTI
ncbi:type II toxin-antitoxin system HigB family toxin [Rufibacter sediminis]|uniref:type II toxin-antitoxin system HigB family toxin n=1 Tax=Rufibacter sediminis TaxID=2762756 RepID=UPI00210ABFE4|nr:type II toxin-antitoxin system HigB family toxin [Rufibacter sediminis]